MKKKGLISLLVAILMCGCSCGRVDESTYEHAISSFNSSDAISFTRIEKVVDKADSNSYTKTTINGSFVFEKVNKLAPQAIRLTKSHLNGKLYLEGVQR